MAAPFSAPEPPPMLDPDLLQRYRAQTFRLDQPLRSKEEAVDYVNQRGFIFFWPITKITLPSLWVAAAGDRPVADAHDDPGHVTWSWKDSLLGKHAWYYAKVLRKKATIISLDLAPSFYALSENYGAPEEDYLTLYEQGRLTQEARAVYKALLDHGALHTIELRKAARLTSAQSDSRFNRALTDLQTSFLIAPIGVADAGAWHYAFIYDTVGRAYPDLLEDSRFIGEFTARDNLVAAYFHSVGAAQLRDLNLLFQWSTTDLERSVERLVKTGTLQRGLQHPTIRNEWFALTTLGV